jgi:hypothetical protein
MAGVIVSTSGHHADNTRRGAGRSRGNDTADNVGVTDVVTFSVNVRELAELAVAALALAEEGARRGDSILPSTKVRRAAGTAARAPRLGTTRERGLLAVVGLGGSSVRELSKARSPSVRAGESVGNKLLELGGSGEESGVIGASGGHKSGRKRAHGKATSRRAHEGGTTGHKGRGDGRRNVGADLGRRGYRVMLGSSGNGRSGLAVNEALGAFSGGLSWGLGNGSRNKLLSAEEGNAVGVRNKALVAVARSGEEAWVLRTGVEEHARSTVLAVGEVAARDGLGDLGRGKVGIRGAVGTSRVGRRAGRPDVARVVKALRRVELRGAHLRNGRGDTVHVLGVKN